MEFVKFVKIPYRSAMLDALLARPDIETEMEKLHRELCPDCPWDGKTIFTRIDDRGDWC